MTHIEFMCDGMSAWHRDYGRITAPNQDTLYQACRDRVARRTRRPACESTIVWWNEVAV